MSYHYDQPRLAQELGLGTCDHPNGLPYSQVNKVVTVIEKLSSNTLDATLIANPGWTTFRDEIRANRPLISFIPGHSRTVAGYTSQNYFLFGCGLMDLLADEIPPGLHSANGSGDVGRISTAADTVHYLEQARQVKLLTLPGEMGDRFQALALTRGLDIPLCGFALRDQRDRL